jgi:hypothetical protein
MCERSKHPRSVQSAPTGAENAGFCQHRSPRTSCAGAHRPPWHWTPAAGSQTRSALPSAARRAPHNMLSHSTNCTLWCIFICNASIDSAQAGGCPHMLLQGAALVSAPRASQVLVQLVVRLLQVRQPRFYLPKHTRQVTGAVGWSAGTSMQTRSADTTTVQSLWSYTLPGQRKGHAPKALAAHLLLHALRGGELCEGSCRRAVRIPIDLRMPPRQAVRPNTRELQARQPSQCLGNVLNLESRTLQTWPREVTHTYVHSWQRACNTLCMCRTLRTRMPSRRPSTPALPAPQARTPNTLKAMSSACVATFSASWITHLRARAAPLAHTPEGSAAHGPGLAATSHHPAWLSPLLCSSSGSPTHVESWCHDHGIIIFWHQQTLVLHSPFRQHSPSASHRQAAGTSARGSAPDQAVDPHQERPPAVRPARQAEHRDARVHHRGRPRARQQRGQRQREQRGAQQQAARARAPEEARRAAAEQRQEV